MLKEARSEGRIERVDGGRGGRGGPFSPVLDRRAETDIPDVLRSRFYDRVESKAKSERTEEAGEGRRGRLSRGEKRRSVRWYSALLSPSASVCLESLDAL